MCLKEGFSVYIVLTLGGYTYLAEGWLWMSSDKAHTYMHELDDMGKISGI